MLDLRFLEKPASLMCWASFLLMPLLMGLGLGALGLVAGAQEGDGQVALTISGLACCSSLGMMFFGVAVMWLIKRAFGGRAGPWLQRVADSTGGQVILPSLLWAFRQPRIEGQIQGQAFRVSLFRQGGILGHPEPGEKRIILCWLLTGHVDAALPGKLGFAPPGTPDLGIGFFGLGKGSEREGLRSWSGDKKGEALVENQELQEAMRRVLSFGGGLFIRGGSGGIHISCRMGPENTPDGLATLLKDLSSLAAAAQRLAQP